jgi:hypothetical protein
MISYLLASGFMQWDVGNAIDQLLGRASGPLYIRLILQPLMAILLAIRGGLRDARAGRPAFLWAVLTRVEARRNMLQSGWKDVSRLFVLALVLDTIYQIVALRSLYPLQALIVAAMLAFVPYVLVRGPVARLARGGCRPKAPASHESSG